MKKKMTSWFPGDVKPVREGIYETDSDTEDGPCFQLWTGSYWGFCSAHSGYALDLVSRSQNPRWRGLAKKP